MIKNTNFQLSRDSSLIARLPGVRGRYSENIVMAGFTWFRVGGAAEVIFRPADLEDLSLFLTSNKDSSPVTVIGATSNLLVRDGGIPGVVIKLGKPFSNILYDHETMRVGSALLNSFAARAALKVGRSGLEFLSGIPGTIGGGLYMNAGSYGSEFKNILIEAEVMDPFGEVHVFSVEDLKMSYRSCGIEDNWIFLSALFKAPPDDPVRIRKKITTIQEQRSNSQPIRKKTGGSTFTNPHGHKAWELIDAAGCRGQCLGGAMVSEQHCNFLINKGNATAKDLEELGESVRRQVYEKSGIKLSWEIKRVGTIKNVKNASIGFLT